MHVLPLKPMAEIRRMIYGGVGIVLGVAITRITGFHVVTHHISVAGLKHTDPLWLAGFVVGIAVTLAPPLWFWVLRPVISCPSPSVGALSASNLAAESSADDETRERR